jgi:hypothetical protein
VLVFINHKEREITRKQRKAGIFNREGREGCEAKKGCGMKDY